MFKNVYLSVNKMFSNLWHTEFKLNKTSCGCLKDLDLRLLALPERVVLLAVFGVNFVEPRLHDESLSVEMREVLFQGGNVGLECREQRKVC